MAKIMWLGIFKSKIIRRQKYNGSVGVTCTDLMQRVKKIALKTVITLGLLVLLLSIVISTPAAQLKITNLTASYFAKEYNLGIEIEGVRFLPFEGQLRFSGITCDNADLELSCKEFDLSGLDLILNQKGHKHIEISGLNWNLGDSIVGSADFVEIDSLIITPDGMLNISSIEVLSAQSTVHDNPAQIQTVDITSSSLSHLYYSNNGFEVKIDTLVSEHLQLNGDFYLDSDLAINTSLFISSEPNNLISSLEHQIGTVNGHIGYNKGSFYTSHLESSIGVVIYNASIDEELENWTIYGHSALEGHSIEIDAFGNKQSSSGALNIDEMGVLQYSIEIDSTTYLAQITSSSIATQWGNLSNIKSSVIGDFDNNISYVSLVSDEYEIEASINNNVLQGAPVKSVGHAVVKDPSTLIDLVTLPLSINQNSTIEWNVSQDYSSVSAHCEGVEYGRLSFLDIDIEASGQLDELEALIECDELILANNGKSERLATGLSIDIMKNDSLAISSSWESTRGLDGKLNLIGDVGDTTLLAFSVVTEALDVDQTTRWFSIPFETDSILLSGTIGGHYSNPTIDLTCNSRDILLLGENISEASLGIHYADGIARISSEMQGLGVLETGTITLLGEIDGENLDLIGSIDDLPLDYVNPLLQENTAVLGGKLKGVFSVEGTINEPLVTGDGEFLNATVGIAYLGTNHMVSGGFHVEPYGIELNGLDVSDYMGGTGFLVGTALHENYTDWNLDVSLLIEDSPMEVMNIPYAADKYFYGTGYGVGDLNVFGYDGQIIIEANLTTTEGTEFVLPLDVTSDSDWSSFVEIKDVDGSPVETPKGPSTEVTLNLDIEVGPESEARIVFDEELGDEITGRCRGHLQIDLHDLKRLEMFGDLEVLEGEYLFTLGSVINKQFTAVPGGRVSWFGDPYNADINITTRYTTNASLKPIMPELINSDKQRVNLDLLLKGDLMRPQILFDIHVPEGNTQEQAALASLISNDEERNRQAISLLVIHQFLPGSWQTAAIGSTGIQENSSELITSQLGYWLSGLSDDVSIGIDYDSANDTGDEAAIAVALSTQLLDDRLHIEGEVGTQNLYTGTAEDLQLQDVRIKYDLVEDGGLQLTGYSTQRATIPGLEGESVQGVGLLFNKDFNSIKDLFKRKSKNQ
jgi:hypothetical protein